MRFERDDAKVGLLVLLAFAVFLALAFHRGLTALLHREVVHRVVLDNVYDLTVGTPVLLQGHRVGEVRSVDLERNGRAYSFVARVGLRRDIVLWRGTRGILVSPVLGSSYLELRLPPLAERKVEIAPGVPIPGELGPSLDSLVSDLLALTRSCDRALADLRQELATRGLAAIFDNPRVAAALDEARAALAGFRKTAQTADDTFAHGDATLAAIDGSMASLDQSLLAVRQLVDRRSPDIEAALNELTSAANRLRNVSVQIEGWITGSGPQAAESLRALRRTLESMEELLELLKAKPNRLVLGTPSDEERAAARERVEKARSAERPAPPPPALAPPTPAPAATAPTPPPPP